MRRGFIFLFLEVFLLLAGADSATVDNSGLLPPVSSDHDVKLEGMSPDWVKSLIMAELRIETATPEGTFDAAVKVLDHYAETGVNGLWIGPVYAREPGKNGYGNFGPDTIDSELTGATSQRDSFLEIRQFVNAAHDRNIRVIFDIVAWGVVKSSPVFKKHPEFFIRLENGEFRIGWGGYLFDWKNPEFREWFRSAAVEFIEETKADGFRVDLAPDTSGYYFKEIRDELYRKGRKVLIMSEMPSEPKGTFDFAQLGVNGWTEPPDYGHPDHFKEQKIKFGSMHDSSFVFRTNIVDAIRSGVGIGLPQLQQKGEGGLFRFYAVSPLYHDGHEPFVKGNRVRFGYLALLPFIPIWWIGEEWNNPRDLGEQKGAMYYNRVNWNAKNEPENAAFFEDVKRILQVRRSYPDIFEHFPERVRDANICKVVSFCNGVPNPLQAYMRYSDKRAVMVVPNYALSSQTHISVKLPWDQWMGKGSDDFTVTDLMTGKVIAEGDSSDLTEFRTELPSEYLGVYLLEQK